MGHVDISRQPSLGASGFRDGGEGPEAKWLPVPGPSVQLPPSGSVGRAGQEKWASRSGMRPPPAQVLPPGRGQRSVPTANLPTRPCAVGHVHTCLPDCDPSGLSECSRALTAAQPLSDPQNVCRSRHIPPDTSPQGVPARGFALQWSPCPAPHLSSASLS